MHISKKFAAALRAAKLVDIFPPRFARYNMASTLQICFLRLWSDNGECPYWSTQEVTSVCSLQTIIRLINDSSRWNWRLECNQKGDKKAALQQPHGNGHGLYLPLCWLENPARYTFAARIAPPLRLPQNSSIAAPPSICIYSLTLAFTDSTQKRLT